MVFTLYVKINYLFPSYKSSLIWLYFKEKSSECIQIIKVLLQLIPNCLVSVVDTFRCQNPGAVFMKGLSQVSGLSWLYFCTKVKPKTWLRPFVNTAPGSILKYIDMQSLLHNLYICVSQYWNPEYHTDLYWNIFTIFALGPISQRDLAKI